MDTKSEGWARRGLELGGRVLRKLREAGIYVESAVSLEHQSVARRYVVRAVESGGAVAELGRYVTYAGENGEAVACHHPLDALGRNGVHAVVIRPALVRVELMRIGRTYQLLITRHQPGSVENGRRPRLEGTVIFRGEEGFLDLELGKRDRKLLGQVLPQFFTRGGEAAEIPENFQAAARAAVVGAWCSGCVHSHYLLPLNASAPTPSDPEEAFASMSGG